MAMTKNNSGNYGMDIWSRLKNNTLSPAMRQGLLSFAAGTLANPSYGHAGTSIGKGLLGGVSGFDQATRTGILSDQQRSTDEYRKYLIDAEEQKAQAAQAAIEAQKTKDAQLMLMLQQGLDLQPTTDQVVSQAVNPGTPVDSGGMFDQRRPTVAPSYGLNGPTGPGPIRSQDTRIIEMEAAANAPLNEEERGHMQALGSQGLSEPLKDLQKEFRPNYAASAGLETGHAPGTSGSLLRDATARMNGVDPAAMSRTAPILSAMGYKGVADSLQKHAEFMEDIRAANVNEGRERFVPVPDTVALLRDKDSGAILERKNIGGKIEYHELTTAEALAQGINLAKAKASTVTSNVYQEREEAKKVGGNAGEDYTALQRESLQANKSLVRYRELERLLEGVNTGKLTKIGTELAGYAKALGFDIDENLGDKEAAIALGREMALELRNPAGGAGMPGALSDPDRKFLESMIPSLMTSVSGVKQMIEFRRKLAGRSLEVAKLARAYRKENGQFDYGFLDELEAKYRNDHLFDDVEVVIPYSDLPRGQ